MKLRLKLTNSYKLEDKTVCGVSHTFKGDPSKERYQKITVANIPFGKYYLESHPCPPCGALIAKARTEIRPNEKSRTSCIRKKT